jgi:hypothetical protein
MKLYPSGAACPASLNPNYYDSNCYQYYDKGNYQYECATCNSDYKLVPVSISSTIYKRCFIKSIRDCTLYNLDGTCSTCIGNVAFDSQGRACPTVLDIKLTNCYQTTVIESNTIVCLACNKGYVIYN